MKITIGQAVISRTDCNAPQCGPNANSDFNINYISAALTAAGGSSGSPAVNIDGQVVGLQCGGFNDSSINFLLPVNLPAKALDHLIRDEMVIYGTIQTKWKIQPLNECLRLGLSSDLEQTFRTKFH